MSKGTVYFVRNGRLVQPGVPSIHDPEYQEILKHKKDKKAICKDLRKCGIQVSDNDDDSCIEYSMIMAMKSLLHDIESDNSLECDINYVEQENLTEKISKILDEIETACNYGEQLTLKERLLRTIDDIKKDIATATKNI